jgi:hypothetical protein
MVIVAVRLEPPFLSTVRGIFPLPVDGKAPTRTHDALLTAVTGHVGLFVVTLIPLVCALFDRWSEVGVTV